MEVSRKTLDPLRQRHDHDLESKNAASKMIGALGTPKCLNAARHVAFDMGSIVKWWTCQMARRLARARFVHRCAECVHECLVYWVTQDSRRVSFLLSLTFAGSPLAWGLVMYSCGLGVLLLACREYWAETIDELGPRTWLRWM